MEFTVNNNTITAYGTINDGDGMEFTNQFKTVENNNKKVIVKLHTYGGSVFDGNLIYNALINSLSDIEIHIVGIAASMGAVISLATDKVYMVENGYIMIHAPSGETYGTITDHENNIKLLRSIEANFIKKLSEKTLKGENYVNKWLVGDNWFDANQALQEGLIAGILTAETKVKGIFDPKQLGAKEVYSRFSALMSNNLNNNKMDLKQQLIKKFKLRSDASDTAIFNAVEGEQVLKDKLIELLQLDLTASDEEIIKSIKTLVESNESVAEERKVEANFLIADAIRKGKIVGGQKQFLAGLFTANFQQAKEFLNNTPERVSITSMMKTPSNSNPTFKGAETSKSDWGIDEYRKFAPQDLANDPELYDRLVKAKFNNK